MKLGVRSALVAGQIVEGDVEISDGRIVAVGLPSRSPGGLAIPGLVDLQVNGYAGVDFLTAEPSDYARAGYALAASGVTSYLPTFITAPEDDVLNATAVARDAANHWLGPARVPGIHLEGPFLSPDYHGVHPVEAMREPDLALLARLIEGDFVRLMTLAPERPNALEIIDVLVARGIAVSCGHTDANLNEATAAFEHGACAVTHLFNAMRPLHHRDPGIVGAALVRDNVTVQLILDGYHVTPEAATIAWRAASGRICLVTDAISAAGMGDGHYTIGAIDVHVCNGQARLSDGTVAGNVRTLLDGVRGLLDLGATVEQAVNAATSVPARLIGRTDLGVLAPGAPADIVVLDERFQVTSVLVAGHGLDV